MSFHLNHYNNQIQKDELCFYGAISYLITGILYFYYLNSIKDCECVNDMYVYNVKKYFILASVMYLINCVECSSIPMSNLLSLLIIICGFGFVYSVRILINDIYKKNCECADTKVTIVINILNYISIFIYIQYAVMITLLLLLLVTVPHESTEYSDKINNLDNMDECEEDGGEDDTEYGDDRETYEKILRTLKSKKMDGGNVESLARSFYNQKMSFGLKKILNKIS